MSLGGGLPRRLQPPGKLLQHHEPVIPRISASTGFGVWGWVMEPTCGPWGPTALPFRLLLQVPLHVLIPSAYTPQKSVWACL